MLPLHILKQKPLTNLIFLLPALGLFVYLFHPLFWSSVIDHDMTTYFYYFYKKLFFSELRNGELPLWNPGVALGYYQAGNPLHGYFYPLNIIFFFLPFDLAYNWLILIHYFLAGLFMYLLVKTLTVNLPASKISPPPSPSPLPAFDGTSKGEGNIAASLFAGITYAFSGVMISLSKNIGFLFGAVWYPLILFSIEKYLNHPGHIEAVAESPKCHPESFDRCHPEGSEGSRSTQDKRQRRIWFFRLLLRNRDSSPLDKLRSTKLGTSGAQNDSRRVPQRSRKYLGLLTLGFCCQFLTGDLQSFVIGIGLAVIQLVIRSCQFELFRNRNRDSSPLDRLPSTKLGTSGAQNDKKKLAPARFALALGRDGLALAGALALALGLSMIQLLPLLDMAWQSYRLHGIPLEEAGYFSLNPQRLLNLFHPSLWGHANLGTFWGENLSHSLTMKQFWYPSIYLGIAPIFLALCSLLKNRQISPSPSPSPLPAFDGTSKGEGKTFLPFTEQCTSPPSMGGDGGEGESFRSPPPSPSPVKGEGYIFMPGNRGLVIWYFVLIAVFFFLACGSFTPIWPWIYSHLPVFSLFRFPAKYFSVVNLFLCVLAGLGLANVLYSPLDNNHPHPNPPPSPPSTGQARGRGIKWIPFKYRNENIFFGGMAALAIAVFSLLLFKYSGFQAEIASHLQINTGRALSELRQGYALLALFSAASVLLIFLLARAKGGKNYLLFVLFLLLGIDIFLGLTPLKVTSRLDFHRTPEIYSRVLSQEEPHSFRLWFDSGSVPFFKTNSYREVLIPNSALDDRVDYFFGNEPALPGRAYELYRFDNLGNLAEFINLADTRYVLTNIQQSGRPIAEIYPKLSGLTPVFTDPEKNILLLRNENARPRFYVVNQWEWVPSGREVLQRMFSDWANPRPAHWPRAFLEANECLKSGRTQNMEKCWDRKFFQPAGGDALPKQIKTIKYSPNRIDLEVQLPSPGLLVFNDSYYPGWRAQADGQDKEIYRSNYLFKGIFLSEGEHRVSFIFRPASYRWGKWVSIFILGTCLLIAILIKFQGRFRPARLARGLAQGAGQNRPGRAAPTKT